MAGRLEDKVAIVIGGSRRVGAAYAIGPTLVFDDGQTVSEAKP